MQSSVQRQRLLGVVGLSIFGSDHIQLPTIGGVVGLVAALWIATGIAQGQSSIPSLPSVATISFSVDSSNCNNAFAGVANSGTIWITINNNERESASYQCDSTEDYIENIASNINANSPWVTAAPTSNFDFGTNGGTLLLISKARGSSTNYPLSVGATYNSGRYTGPAYVPSAPATMNTFGSRNFTMTVFADTSDVGPDEDVAWIQAKSDLSQTGGNDLATGLSTITVSPLLPNPNQPRGANNLPQYNLPQKDFQGNPYDYNKIEAVNVDEPYVFAATSPPWTNPCHDGRYSTIIQPVFQQLQGLAQQIRQNAPKTRFWVNYSEPEVQWMMDTTCDANHSMAILNSPFIDVVSMDKYSVPFPGTTACLVPQQPGGCVQPYYDFLVAHRAYPGQQIALVPGIFTNAAGSSADSSASLLQGFFGYASSQNQVCNNPLGNTGATGHGDGCLVWMVIGFAAHAGDAGLCNSSQCGGSLIGEDDPGGAPIQQVWRAEVSLPVTIPVTRPSSITTVLSGGVPFTYFFDSGRTVWDIWCTASGCAWDYPSGDAAKGPDGAPPSAEYGGPLNAVTTTNGVIVYYLTPPSGSNPPQGDHLISLNTSLGFSDTWQDVTAAGGLITAGAASPLATVLNGQTPWNFFLKVGSGTVISNWCTTSGCAWDDPTDDASRGPDGASSPAAVSNSPLNVVATTNGLIAYYLTPSGHLISLNTSLGFSDTWQDVTAAGGLITAGAGSPLATVLNGQTPFTFFLKTGSGTVISNWCSTSGCAWDDPTDDAAKGPNGTAPQAAIGSPLSVVAAPSGLIAYYLTSNGHVISLNTSLGFSDTWQDVTAASGAPGAANESPLTVVVTPNGTSVTHFVVPGGHLYSISCSASGQCTSTDETASANLANIPVAFF